MEYRHYFHWFTQHHHQQLFPTRSVRDGNPPLLPRELLDGIFDPTAPSPFPSYHIITREENEALPRPLGGRLGWWPIQQAHTAVARTRGTFTHQLFATRCLLPLLIAPASGATPPEVLTMMDALIYLQHPPTRHLADSAPSCIALLY